MINLAEAAKAGFDRTLCAFDDDIWIYTVQVWPKNANSSPFYNAVSGRVS